MERHWGEKKTTQPRKSGAEATEKHISVQDNKIYFYSGVNRNACSELNKKISEMESKSLTLSNSLEIQPPPIKLFIIFYCFPMEDLYFLLDNTYQYLDLV